MRRTFRLQLQSFFYAYAGELMQGTDQKGCNPGVHNDPHYVYDVKRSFTEPGDFGPVLVTDCQGYV